MKRLALFLKTTTLGGLFVVLPLMVVFGLLAKVVMGVHEAAESLMTKMAGEHSEAAHFPILFAILIVVGISFALGLALTSRRGQATGNWVERTLLRASVTRHASDLAAGLRQRRRQIRMLPLIRHEGFVS